MPYTVKGVSRETLDDWWPVVEPMLSPALDRGGDLLSISDVKEHIRSGRCMLWIVEETTVVAALVMHLPDDRDSLMVWLMGGRDFSDWQPTVQPLLQRYARDVGRTYVEAYARPGLAKKLRKSGWRTRHELVAVRA